MNIAKEVIIDLLPAYFSGEASVPTRTLVEDYFRENPEFEREARSGTWTLEGLQLPVAGPDKEKEKLALERARMVVETRGSFLWMAICFTVLLLIFKIQNHKLIFIMWQKPRGGFMFSAVALLCWLFYFRTRIRPEPLRAHTKFLWMASFYTILLGVLSIPGWGGGSIFSGEEQNVGIIMAGLTLGLWVTYFYLRRKNRRETP